ncbi:MAG: DUF72 domain-containing protein [Bacteroidota bacterium]
MKFGKLGSPDQILDIDFRLPENDVQFSSDGQMRDDFMVYVGCPMWGNKGWIGKLYPKGTKAGDYLQYYSQSFNTIELNSTHYRTPTDDIADRWREAAADGFHFCPKIPQSISHYRKLVNVTEDLQRFTDVIQRFEDHLGASFVQLHESFSPQLLGNLIQFVDQWPAQLPLSIEFRNTAWFENNRLIPEASEVLLRKGIGAVITDVSGRRDVLHATLTSNVVVIRFVGNALHPTDYSRADTWIDKLEEWKKLGIKAVYFFVHEPDDAFAPEMGSYVIEKLNERFDLALRIPGIPDEGGEQMSLF